MEIEWKKSKKHCHMIIDDKLIKSLHNQKHDQAINESEFLVYRNFADNNYEHNAIC